MAPLGSRRSPAQTPAWATGQCPEASSALQLAEPKDALPAGKHTRENWAHRSFSAIGRAVHGPNFHSACFAEKFQYHNTGPAIVPALASGAAPLARPGPSLA